MEYSKSALTNNSNAVNNFEPYDLKNIKTSTNSLLNNKKENEE